MLYPFRLFLTLKTLVSRMSDVINVISVSNVNNCSNAIGANIVSNGSNDQPLWGGCYLVLTLLALKIVEILITLLTSLTF